MGWCYRDISNINNRWIVNVRNPTGGKNHGYMSLDYLVRAGLGTSANVLPMTQIVLGAPIWKNTTLNSIDWDAETQGYLDDGDSITIFDENGNGQTFIVTDNVDFGDTSLILDGAITLFDIKDGYEIVLNTLGIIRREIYGQTINPNTLFDVTIGLPDFSKFGYLSDNLINKIVRVEVNGVSWYYENSAGSPARQTWDIDVTGGNQMKFTSPIRPTDRVILHVKDPLLYS